MSMIRRTTGLVGAAAISVSALGAPVAAHAAMKSFPDPADATGSPTDIRNVRVNHAEKRLAVVTKFTSLKRNSEATSSLKILIDTLPNRPGAEFVLLSGLQWGTDYTLLRARHGKPVGEPLNCAHNVTLKFAKNNLRFGAARSCLGNPNKVRVAVRMDDHSDASHPIVDWLGAPASYSAWVARP